jgi:hypothetical protein
VELLPHHGRYVRPTAEGHLVHPGTPEEPKAAGPTADGAYKRPIGPVASPAWRRRLCPTLDEAFLRPLWDVAHRPDLPPDSAQVSGRRSRTCLAHRQASPTSTCSPLAVNGARCRSMRCY